MLNLILLNLIGLSVYEKRGARTKEATQKAARILVQSQWLDL